MKKNFFLKGKIPICASFCTLILLLSPPLYAENSTEDSDVSVKLGESIVSPDYIEIEKLKSTKKVIVIDKNDIEDKGFLSLSEVLNDVPGITVGVSGWGEIDIRGQGAGQAAKNVQVLVDGSPITLLMDHPFKANYDVIPVEQIEKIEVIPGGGSVLYGGGTSGGVVNITTNLKGMGKPVNKFGYEYTHDNEVKYNASVGAKLGEDLTIQTNYSHSNKDWYFVDTYDNTQYFSSGLNYRLSDTQAVSMKYSRFREEGRFIMSAQKDDKSWKEGLETHGKNYRPKPSTITVGIDEHGQKVKKNTSGYTIADRQEEDFKASYTGKFFDNTTVLVDIFHRDGYFKNNKFEGDDDQVIDQETIGWKAKFNVDYGKKNSIIFGIDYITQTANLSYDEITYRSTKKGDKPDTSAGEYANSFGTIKNASGQTMYKADRLAFDYDKKTKAAYFLNIFKFSDFEFTLGARYDRTDWQIYKKAAGGWGVIGDTSHRDNMNYETSLGWNYRDTGKLYARYEKSFTSPNAKEIADRVYVDGKKATVITDGEDQIYDIYEIGLRDYIFGSAINLTAFYNHTDNQIYRMSDNSSGNWEWKTLNIFETTRYGLEFTAQQQIGKFSFEEAYTYLMGKSEYNSKGEAKKGKVKFANDGLQKVPRDNITFKADFEATENLVLSAKWKYTGSYNNFTEMEDKDDKYSLIESYSTTDLSFRYKHPKGFSIHGGVNNIFDEEYFGYFSDYGYVVPQNGITYFAGFSYKF